jgi:two-component system sensor histidine kinase YesM
MYIGTRNALVEQEYKNESERLESEAETIENSMNMVEEFSEKIYYDNGNQKVCVRQYSGYDDIMVDYKDFDQLIEYAEAYYPFISSISIYLNESDRIDNRYFKLITDTIKEKNWYKNTMKNNGAPYWSYMTNVQTGSRSLRLTKELFNKEYRVVGVISIALSNSISEDFVTKSEATSMLVFNDEEIVHSNISLKDDELESIMDIVYKNSNDWLQFRGKKCQLFKAEISLRFGDEKYYLVTIKPYSEIVTLANKSSMGGLVPLMLGTLIATIAIVALSDWFSKRINSFRNVMHEAAAGNFNTENTEIGLVRDEIWDLNNDLNQMIHDIKQLMETAMQERIQKEQLYSRQKEVEFKMLATQINPHFLYNTLENIRMLARINKQPEIEDISVNLNKLLRRSLNVKHELTTLLWEMEMIEYYIRIQDYRFGDRIKAELDYDKELAEKYMVIPLCVQPFVENAYVHAMEDKEADGKITVRVEMNEILTLYIEDNGHGMSREKLEEVTRYLNDFDNLDRQHIGICNVNQRIKLKFGNSYGVDFESEENVGTKVKISMPLVSNIE